MFYTVFIFRVYDLVKIWQVKDNKEDAYSRTGGIFIRDTAQDSMKHKVTLHWITMNMPNPVGYPVWSASRTGVHILL